MAYIVISPEFLPYVSTAVNMIISFTPLLSYGSTVLSIRRKQSSQGFSIDICGTMLVASILRIFYYFNDPFEVTLLRQCFVMVFIQVILLRVALKYRSDDAVHFETYHGNWERLFNQFITSYREAIEDTFEQYNSNYETFEPSSMILELFVVILKCLRVSVGIIFACALQIVRDVIRLFDYHYIRPFHYWQWRQAITFWKFLVGFVTFLSLVQIIFNGNEYLGITFGSLSFMIESSLPLPQILLFQRLKHVENFKVILLLSWLGGDLTKISYLFYGTDNVGMIFIIAAFFQMSLNCVITYQFFYYKFNPSTLPNEYQMSYLPVSHNGQLSPSPYSSRSHTDTSTYPSVSLGSSFTDKTSPIFSGVPVGRASMSRASSVSLTGMLGSNSKTNVVPQQQHFQYKKSLSHVDEEKMDDLLAYGDSKRKGSLNGRSRSMDSKMARTEDEAKLIGGNGDEDGDEDDGIDLAEGVDVSDLVSKLGGEKKAPGFKKFNDKSIRRSTSVDATNMIKNTEGEIELSLENGVVETVRSRASTLHTSPGRHVGDVFPVAGVIHEEKKGVDDGSSV